MMRFKELRQKMRMSQAEVAKELGVHQTLISQYERGMKQPSMEMAIKAANLFGTTVGFLLGEEDSAVWNELPVYEIPVYGSISCGTPKTMVGELIGTAYTSVSPTHGQLFFLIANGDSMDVAGIRDGSQVLIRKQSVVENGSIAAVSVNGEEATLKRFYQDGKIVTLIPMSTNPEHAPQRYDLEVDRVDVIGLALKVESDLSYR